MKQALAWWPPQLGRTVGAFNLFVIVWGRAQRDACTGYGDPVFTRPRDLSDQQVAARLAAVWSLDVDQLAYVPRGFGSHHWAVSTPGDRWFATVDDLDARRWDRDEAKHETAARLGDALNTARLLYDGGLDFVVAPVRSTSGQVLESLGDRYVIALYPFIDGEVHEFGPYPSSTARLEIIDRLVEIHRAPEAIRWTARTDDLTIPGRRDLESLVANRSLRWGPGPFAERTKTLLDRHAEPLRDVLDRFDAQARKTANDDHRFVLTHGEPHRANTITAPDGIRLIDWDTALLAPPERDLWMLADEDPSIIDTYSTQSGIDIDDAALRLFGLWWDLCEISLFVNLFSGAHIDSQDTRIASAALDRHLDPDRWDDLR